MGPAPAIIVGLALIAAYVWLGVWAVRTAWSWSSDIDTEWIRLALVSTVATFFFMPGIVGGGHGVGVGPAWLMLAGGTFGALTTASKLKALIAIVVGWVIAFSIGILVVGSRTKGRSTDDDNPFR